jgi:hypothetical protein
MTDALRSVLGSGVFNTNGDLWRFHRSMSRPFFTRDRLRDIIPVFVRHADRAIDLITKRNDNNTGLDRDGLATIDVQDLTSRLTLDATTEFLFGSCVNSLEEELPRPWNDASAPPLTPCTTTSTSPVEDTTSPSSTLGSSKLSKNLDKSSSPPTPKRSNSQDSILPTTTTSSTSSDAQTPAFPSAFASALHTLASRLRLGSLWPLLEIRRDGTGKDVKIIREFVAGIVKRALERREERERMEDGQRYQGEEKPEVVEKGETLLDHLVTVSDGEQLGNFISLTFTKRGSFRPPAHSRRVDQYSYCWTRHNSLLHDFCDLPPLSTPCRPTQTKRRSDQYPRIHLSFPHFQINPSTKPRRPPQDAIPPRRHQRNPPTLP